MKSDTFTVEIEATLENLSAINSIVSEAMERGHIDSDTAAKVLMAVDEACTNIILYAYPQRKGLIRLSCRLNHEDFIVSIEDKGIPFNPCAVPPPDIHVDLDHRGVGGLGVHFMRTFMDEISYRYDPEAGNLLTMRKHVGARSS